MRAPISVILPTLNAAPVLGPGLGALSEALAHGLIHEVIFADGGSQDATLAIAEEVGATVVSAPPGRGIQLAKAAKTARGDWLMFLHADSILQHDWPTKIRHHLGRPDTAHYFQLAFDEASIPAKTVATWANWRAGIFGLPYGDQGLLISRALYKRIGGYDEIPLMEDVAIARKLRGKLAPLPITITTSAEKYRRDGWARRSFANAALLVRYKFGVDPATLARQYR